MTDSIADMLTRIRNAYLVRKTEVWVPASKMKKKIAEILAAEGYLESVSESRDAGQLLLLLKLGYAQGHPNIKVTRRVSTPGRRVYVSASKLPHVFDDMGIALISTPQGLMTNKQARAKHLGGEVICEVF